jgi:hypothetical protein
MKSRFKKLKALIQTSVVDNDCFGLTIQWAQGSFNPFTRNELSILGGPGSGHFGHAGRPGKVGGSGAGGGKNILIPLFDFTKLTAENFTGGAYTTDINGDLVKNPKLPAEVSRLVDHFEIYPALWQI